MKRQGFTREVFAASLSRDDFVLLSIPFFARRDDFVGQVGNLRRIVNPPAGSEHNAGESPEKLAACRSAGLVSSLRPIVNRPSEVSRVPEERRLPTAAQDAILPHNAFGPTKLRLQGIS